MKTRNTPRPKRTEEELRVIEHEAGGAAAGAIIGATAGAIAGPPGSVAGAILGGLAGGLAATVIEREDKADSIRDQELDAAIGVSGGEMGAPNLKHPPAKVGAYSSAAAGAGPASSDSPAEGPFQAPED